MSGNPFPEEIQGKALLIVTTASACGFRHSPSVWKPRMSLGGRRAHFPATSSARRIGQQ
jgi:hypothetical protein